MLDNYQKFDDPEEFNQGQQLNDNPKIQAITVFVSLFAQLMYLLGWVGVLIYTEFGQTLLYDRLVFAITFPLIGLVTIIIQALLLHQKENNQNKQFQFQFYQKFLAIAFLLINGFFVSYLMLFLSKRLFFYPFYGQDWILLIYMGILLLAFIIIPSTSKKYRWIVVLVIPALINFVMGFFYYHLDLQFQAWLFIFCVVCLYMTQIDYGMGEFYLSLNIMGFVTLFLINTVQYIINGFSNKSYEFVIKLQEQKQVQFIFFTYIIAAISTLLTPLITKMFEWYNYGFFGGSSLSFWIILSLNYIMYFFLFLTHRYLQLQVKQFIALAYLIIHQLSVTGIIFVLRFYYSLIIFYYYIGFLEIQFLFAAITLQINQKFCLKSLYHILLMVPVIANFSIFLNWAYPAVNVLIIIVNSFLIIYLGQQCLNEVNFFLQFKEDEYLISGALFSDPIALFLTQSIFVHFKTKQ